MIVNLNRHRKKQQRAIAEAKAAENRVRFGRSKEARNLDRRERQRANNEIDGKRLSPDPNPPSPAGEG